MVTLPVVSVAEIMTDVGFDWLFIDGEHGPLNTTEVLAILQAVDRRIACIVRVPQCDEAAIKKMLDIGAGGIIVPQVNSAEQAADVVRFARYAPAGARGVGLARAHGYGFRFEEYVQSANDNVSVIVQAEHALAVENIDAIVRVPGVDAIMLGPYDLAASLGKMGQVNDPLVVDAIKRIKTACDEVSMPIGYFGVTANAIKPYMEEGYTLICAGVDTLFLGQAAKQVFSELS